MTNSLNKNIVITGHSGSGKTNLAINLAVHAAQSGRDVVLADLDVVNPYFRSADFAKQALEQNIELIAPAFANSNLDIPALTGQLDAALRSSKTVIVDVGGDDAGAIALGRYSAFLRQLGYSMLYCINGFRYLTRQPPQALELLEEIQAAARLPATHIINTSNLAEGTTAEDILSTVPFAQQTAELAGLPLLGTVVEKSLLKSIPLQADLFGVDVYVKKPWSP